MAQLICKDVTLGYENITLARNLNFSVNAGDYLCIVGENGTGKSTLIKTILHLRKPLAGTIHYSDGLTSTQVGYLPQQTTVQKDFPASVHEIVISGFQGKTGLRPFYSKAEKEGAREAMKRLGIENLENMSYMELSGGQQQRVLLARALCAADKLLLLDEPATGLDPYGADEMYKTIKSLNEEGISIIMITHDIQAALQFATHILHIGSTLFFGTRDEYMKSREGLRYIRFHKEADRV